MKNKTPKIGTIEYEMQLAKENCKKPRLLLHACCGPCASSVLEYLTPLFDVTVFYYNPNILPKEEFIKRENALKDVIAHFDGVKLIIPEQDETEYISYVKGHKNDREGGARCSLCFTLRLEKPPNFLNLIVTNLIFCNDSHGESAQKRSSHQSNRQRRCK